MFPKYTAPMAVACLLAACLALAIASHKPQVVTAAATVTPAYTSSGEMLSPTNYREWIYLTTGIDMSYFPKPAGMEDHSMFDNVFVNPEAYRSFLEKGTWPDKTVMVLEAREARSKGSINQHGQFQTDWMGMAVEVKDSSRFPDKWAYFTFGGTNKTSEAMPKANPCWQCHEDHAAVEHTFVQFYPTLKPVAKKFGVYNQSREQVQDAK